MATSTPASPGLARTNKPRRKALIQSRLGGARPYERTPAASVDVLLAQRLKLGLAQFDLQRR